MILKVFFLLITRLECCKLASLVIKNPDVSMWLLVSSISNICLWHICVAVSGLDLSTCRADITTENSVLTPHGPLSSHSVNTWAKQL